MTTIAQVQKLVRPFLDRHPDYALQERRVFKWPVEHLMVGMALKASGHKDLLLSVWFVGAMFVPPWSGSGVSGTMDRATGISGFHHVVPEMERTDKEILSPLASFEAMLATDESVFFGGMDDFTRSVVLLASGRFDEGERLLADFIVRREAFEQSWQAQFGSRIRPGTKRWQRNQEDSAAEQDRVNTMKHLLAIAASGDRRALAALLKQWEAARAHALGIEKYWRPTPFAFEAQISV
jgi:hypothetical protein